MAWLFYRLMKLKKKFKINSKEFVLKAQIHAGGRGKAGGVNLLKILMN